MSFFYFVLGLIVGSVFMVLYVRYKQKQAINIAHAQMSYKKTNRAPIDVGFEDESSDY